MIVAETLTTDKLTFRCGCGDRPTFGQEFTAVPELVCDMGDGVVVWARCPFWTPSGQPRTGAAAGQPHSRWIALDELEATHG